MTKPVKRKGPLRVLDDEMFRLGKLALIHKIFFERPVNLRSLQRKLKREETKSLQRLLEIARESNITLGPSKPTFSDDAFEQIERKLGLASPDDELRERLHYEVQRYCLDAASPIAYKTVRHAVLRRELEGIKDAANSLRKKLYSENKVIPMEERPLVAAVMNWFETSSVSRDAIIKVLDGLCSAIDSQKKSKGGRPRKEAWSHMMARVMDLYRQKTGKQPTVTESEPRAGAGERYSGSFVSIAAIVDRAAASFTGTPPLPNSTLGARLRRLQQKLSAT